MGYERLRGKGKWFNGRKKALALLSRVEGSDVFVHYKSIGL